MDKVLQKGRFKIKADNKAALDTYLKLGWEVVEDEAVTQSLPEEDYDETGDTEDSEKPPKSKKRG